MQVEGLDIAPSRASRVAAPPPALDGWSHRRLQRLSFSSVAFKVLIVWRFWSLNKERGVFKLHHFGQFLIVEVFCKKCLVMILSGDNAFLCEAVEVFGKVLENSHYSCSTTHLLWSHHTLGIDPRDCCKQEKI